MGSSPDCPYKKSVKDNPQFYREWVLPKFMYDSFNFNVTLSDSLAIELTCTCWVRVMIGYGFYFTVPVKMMPEYNQIE